MGKGEIHQNADSCNKAINCYRETKEFKNNVNDLSKYAQPGHLKTCLDIFKEKGTSAMRESTIDICGVGATKDINSIIKKESKQDKDSYLRARSCDKSLMQYVEHEAIKTNDYTTLNELLKFEN